MKKTANNQDTLPAYCRARVLVLGVGNPLFGDDGFGPAVVATLRQKYRIPDDICLLDVGTGIRKLMFTLLLSNTQPEEIVIFDAVDGVAQTDQVTEISLDSLPDSRGENFSLHQVPTSKLLKDLQERCGLRVRVLVWPVIQLPDKVEMGLSASAKSAVESAAQMVARWYHIPQKRNEDGP